MSAAWTFRSGNFGSAALPLDVWPDIVVFDGGLAGAAYRNDQAVVGSSALTVIDIVGSRFLVESHGGGVVSQTTTGKHHTFSKGHFQMNYVLKK